MGKRTIGWSSLSQLNGDTISGGPDTSNYEVTDDFRESKARTPSSSNPKRWSLGRTTWPYHRGKLHMPSFDFSMDPGGRAIFETSLVTDCLEIVYNLRSRQSERINYERLFLISLSSFSCNKAGKYSQTRRDPRVTQTDQRGRGRSLLTSFRLPEGA